MSKRVKDIADKYGVGMEAMLGQMMGVENDMVVDESESVLTDPENAKTFCDALDLSAFACAVGTAHGFHKGEPKSISIASPRSTPPPGRSWRCTAAPAFPTRGSGRQSRAAGPR